MFQMYLISVSFVYILNFHTAVFPNFIIVKRGWKRLYGWKRVCFSEGLQSTIFVNNDAEAWICVLESSIDLRI